MPSISHVRFQSDILDRAIDYSALMPDIRDAGLGPYPVLYLLHPSGGDHASWLLNARLERVARGLPLLVILPSLGNSLGCDMASGEDFEHFFVDELMAHVESQYAALHGPENTAVAGAGTGGYAALRYALTYPYWFGTGAALSPDAYAAQEKKLEKRHRPQERIERYRRVFGDANDPRRKAYDLFALAEGLDRSLAPALYLDCGKEDPVFPGVRDFHRKLSSLRIRHDFMEQAGGHDWEYWNGRLPDMTAFIAKGLGI